MLKAEHYCQRLFKLTYRVGYARSRRLVTAIHLLVHQIGIFMLNGYSSRNIVTLTYRCTSEDGFHLKLKVEISTREHFAVLG